MRTPGRSFQIAACLGSLMLAAPAPAQEDPSKYPSRAIHIIVGFAAGGGNDIIARVFGQKLFGETRPTITVTTAAIAMFRIRAPSPT